MLRLLLPKANKHNNSENHTKHSHVGIHMKALAEYSQMSAIVLGFELFSALFSYFSIDQISHQQPKG